ncbi:MAG: pantoate--beta-alanine ligase [Phycisphaerales bacterium]|nr:pantoate--beta-alanine ligase [Phycisphaerales bacterium]
MLWKTVAEAREGVRTAQRAGQRVGLVPTMGALHEGHASLMRAARRDCGFVVVTLFVNPAQFAPGEDFNRYPRTLERDLDLMAAEGVSAAFVPDAAEMYPRGAATTVHVSGLTDGLCGPLRPGHFDGVATIVAKLFNALPADAAYFGEKDYQQLQVVRRLVRDLNMPIDIIGCPTVREPDGLALSSRNAYLSPTDRAQAACLSAALFEAQRRISEGLRDPAAIISGIRKCILAAGPAVIQYVEIVDPQTLRPLNIIEGEGRIILAVLIGTCRLIDNVAATAPGA